MQQHGGIPSCLQCGGRASRGKEFDPPEFPGLGQETPTRHVWASVCTDPPLAHRGPFLLRPGVPLLPAPSRGSVYRSQGLYFNSLVTNPCRPDWPEACLCIPASRPLGTRGLGGCEDGFVWLLRLAWPRPLPREVSLAAEPRKLRSPEEAALKPSVSGCFACRGPTPPGSPCPVSLHQQG